MSENSPSNPRPAGAYAYDVSEAHLTGNTSGYTPVGTVRMFTEQGRAFEIELRGECVSVRVLGSNGATVHPVASNTVEVHAIYTSTLPLAHVNGVGFVGGE